MVLCVCVRAGNHVCVCLCVLVSVMLGLLQWPHGVHHSVPKQRAGCSPLLQLWTAPTPPTARRRANQIFPFLLWICLNKQICVWGFSFSSGTLLFDRSLLSSQVAARTQRDILFYPGIKIWTTALLDVPRVRLLWHIDFCVWKMNLLYRRPLWEYCFIFNWHVTDSDPLWFTPVFAAGGEV